MWEWIIFILAPNGDHLSPHHLLCPQLETKTAQVPEC